MNIRKNIQDLLRRLTLDEKNSMIHGAGLFETAAVERLGIPRLVMSDGPMGIRREFPPSSWESFNLSTDLVSYLPSNMALASSWSENLAAEFGAALGREARGRGKDVILAPGINIVRSPLGGRTFEYLSEDPHLVSRLVAPLVQGIQGEDVAACVKHFVANNHEHNRLSISVEMDNSTLHEIYFPGFKAAVQDGGALTVMAAYNRFRGSFCCENSWLLKTVLREEWGFQGAVISDWGAVHSTEGAAASGLDIEMHVHTDFHTHVLADQYREKIRSGQLSESDLDDKVFNVLTLMHRLGMFAGRRKTGFYNSEETRRAALNIARDSVVLLKNDNGILPLSRAPGGRILVIGENAERCHSNGGGSAEVRSLFEMSPLLGLSMAAGGNIHISYEPGYSSQSETDESEQAEHRRKALEAAANHDGSIIYVGGLNHQYDTEERDRHSLSLPYGQDALIQSLLEIRPDTIVVNISGSPVEMPWIDQAGQVVQLFYAGMFSGQALGEVVFGDVNPSGKLPLTFPRSLNESPAHYYGEWPGDQSVEYKEGLLVGYRFNDARNIPPLFGFGHGLSYSRWEYSSLRLTPTAEGLSLSFSLANITDRSGQETVQIYVRDLQKKRGKHFKELRAFRKIELQARASVTVEITLCPEDLMYYDQSLEQMQPGGGDYHLYIGSSSTDIRLDQPFSI